ncbi:MAG: SurA N-terminal domain-containing protein [Bacteroidales bacterium]|nr:SurA N-terminal domain-containing protein [Bacteroidales bacterium]
MITVLVALALLSFILDPQTLRSAAERFSSDNKVGSMNGKSITYKEFYDELGTYTEIAKLMGQNPSSEEQHQQLRDAAWQSIFDNEVFIPKAQEAGLAVGEKEMFDLTQGVQISPVLQQQGAFLDENGNFSREALASFVQAIDTDETGSYATYWSFLEESVYRNQLYTKYNSLIQNSDVLTNLEKSRLVAEGNVTADVDFVFSPISFADSTVTVTPAEITAFYNEHKDQFKQPANRDIEYVMWEVVPSAQDFADAKAEYDELYAQFAEADNLKSFVTLNSDSKWNGYYFSEDQLASTPEFQETAFRKPAGTVSPIVTEETSYAAIRVADTKMMSDSARVFYKVYPLSEEADADAFVAAQLKKPVESEFTEMGWATQDFFLGNNLADLAVVLDASQPKVIKVKNVPSQTVFALYVPERTKPMKKVQLATLLKNVLPSDETYRDFQMKAVEFADACDGKYANFQKIAQEQNLPVIPINNMVQSDRRIGVADNAREVVYWVFDKKTKAGDVSDLKIVDNRYYFVTAVTKVRKEGYADPQEMAPQIRTVLLSQKSVEKHLADVRAQIEGMTSLEQIAEALNTTVSHSSGVSFGSVQYGQTDPAFLGAVSVAPEGTIQSVGGQIGVYVFEVSNRNAGSFFSDSDADMQLNRRASWHSSILQGVIANEADIKDNRARFF